MSRLLSTVLRAVVTITAGTPLVAELRAQQNTYQRLLAALGLPTGVLGEQARPVTRNRKTKFEVEKLRPVPREGSVS